MYREIWSKVPGPWDLYDVVTDLGCCVANLVYSKFLTGLITSRSHHIASLVHAGDWPKIIIGSHNTRHSQIDQRWDNDASNI